MGETLHIPSTTFCSCREDLWFHMIKWSLQCTLCFSPRMISKPGRNVWKSYVVLRCLCAWMAATWPLLSTWLRLAICRSGAVPSLVLFSTSFLLIGSWMRWLQCIVVPSIPLAVTSLSCQSAAATSQRTPVTRTVSGYYASKATSVSVMLIFSFFLSSPPSAAAYWRPWIIGWSLTC